jgi:hypothetical protein
MTVVTKHMNAKPEKRQDARLFVDTGQWRWGGMNEGGLTFQVGDYYVARLSLDVPKGATITLAQFAFMYNQKDPAPAQTADLSLAFEVADNSAPWPYVDATLVTATTPPTFPRTLSTPQTFQIAFPGGDPAGPEIITRTVTSEIQALVNRSGWEAGSYLTVALLCTAEGPGSDLSIQTRDNDFAEQQPQIKVTYTVDIDDPVRTDVNLLLNETMADTSEVFNNSLFGFSMDNTVYSTDPTGGRDGGPCLRVTGHPPADQNTRACLALMGYEGLGDESYVLSGWFYNPTSNAVDFTAEFIFRGGFRFWPQRDVWHPFATNPVLLPSEGAPLWCGMGLMNGPPKADGVWFLLDDVCLTRTNVGEMPFTGAFTDKWNADYAPKETAQHGASVRRNRMRTHVLIDGVSKPRRAYVRQDDFSPWVRANPQKMP